MYRDYRSGGSSSSRRRSPSPRRRRSPGPSSHRRDRSRDRERSRERDRERERQRKDTDLPSEFSRDRGEDDDKRKLDDNRDVLERMEKSYGGGPLQLLHRSAREQLKLKVWTRNFKEVRGICTGFVTAFDKHWNLALQDVDEICLKPKKGKTPYLYELKPGDLENIQEAQPKVPREKKKEQPKESEKPEEGANTETSAGETTEGEQKPQGEKKRTRKKKKTKIEKRHVKQLFIRGDNVVMIAILAPTAV